MALEGGEEALLNVHSVFKDHSSVSETCEYRIERSLTHMSKWRDYLIEFEWSVPGVEEENTAVYVLHLDCIKDLLLWVNLHRQAQCCRTLICVSMHQYELIQYYTEAIEWQIFWCA